jgi:hypothetical protein
MDNGDIAKPFSNIDLLEFLSNGLGYIRMLSCELQKENGAGGFVGAQAVDEDMESLG